MGNKKNIIAVIAGLTVTGVLYFVKTQYDNHSEPISYSGLTYKEDIQLEFDIFKINQAEIGMNYEQLKEIIGQDGEYNEDLSTEDTECYTWHFKNDDQIYAYFQEGQLESMHVFPDFNDVTTTLDSTKLSQSVINLSYEEVVASYGEGILIDMYCYTSGSVNKEYMWYTENQKALYVRFKNNIALSLNIEE